MKEPREIDFAFSRHLNGSVPYTKEMIRENLINEELSAPINYLTYSQLKSALEKVRKKIPDDVVGNHLFERTNGYIFSENGTIALYQTQPHVELSKQKILHKFKTLEEAVDLIFEVKETDRLHYLQAMVDQEKMGIPTSLTKHAHPKIVEKALNQAGIDIPQSVINLSEKYENTTASRPDKNVSELSEVSGD